MYGKNLMSALEARGLSKAFTQAGTRIDVLNALDLALAPAETLAIQGSSGSGKSTLLALLAGLDHADSGTLTIGGEDVTRLDERAWARFRARHIGIVFQQFHLLSHLTALENVSLPLELRGDSAAIRLAQEALDQVGLTPRSTHFPHQLSGGERQRVAIARALGMEPTLLLADEPSGNLDTHTGERVMDLFFDLVKRRGMSLILVTHDEALARRCQRRLVLREGRLNPA
jgi:putative ABC transport system ATP-binding protein